MKRVALIVGINRYEDPEISSLDYAENDAVEVYSFLKGRLEFSEVKNLLNPDSDEVLDIAHLMSHGLSAGDLFFLYFAGHGIENNGQHLLLCPKTKYSRIRHQQHVVALDLLKEETAKAGVHRVFVLDTCRNELLTGQRSVKGGGTRDVGCIRNLVEDSKGVQGSFGVICSCDQGECSRELATYRQGLFSLSFIEAVKERTQIGEGVYFSDSLSRAIAKKMNDFGEKVGILVTQRPWVQSSGELPPLIEPERSKMIEKKEKAEEQPTKNVSADLKETDCNKKNEEKYVEKGPIHSNIEHWHAVPQADETSARTKIKPISRRTTSILIGVLITFSVFLVSFLIITKEIKYSRAVSYFESGETMRARMEFLELGRYRDAEILADKAIGVETYTISKSKKIQLKMKLIQNGSFTIGFSTSEVDRDDDEDPIHRVTISKPFYIGVFEVTQAQWVALMDENPSVFLDNPNNPVEGVSWYDCQEFIKRLNRLGIGTYRLPTEAEWEYACRAGNETRFFWGDDNKYSRLGEFTWYLSNSSDRTHPVGQKKPSPWGLYDIHGNVWEWCSDWYGSYSGGEQIDPEGPEKGSLKIMRGGSWHIEAKLCRSAYRHASAPDRTFSSTGLRLVREID